MHTVSTFEDSKAWYRLGQRPLFNSGFEGDELAAYGQDGFLEMLDGIGEDVYIYDKAIYRAPVKVRAMIQNATQDVYNSTFIRQILCGIGILHCGQYVRINGGYWLVSGLPDNNGIYEKALLWKCRYTINIISPLTGEIVHYPVYDINSTQYGTGEWRQLHINIGEDQHLLCLPYNEETVMIDDNFRFLMDKRTDYPTAYRITRVDTTSYGVGSELPEDGLLQWSILQTQFNPRTDNRELMIADYWKDTAGDTTEPDDGPLSLLLTDLDGDFSIAIGEEKEIEVSLQTCRGVRIQDFEWTLDSDLADGAAEVLSQEGNIIRLKAKFDRRNVGKHITLHAVCESEQLEASMTLTIVNC